MTIPTTSSMRRTRRKIPEKPPITAKFYFLVIVIVVAIYASSNRHPAVDSKERPSEPQCSFREYPLRRYYGRNQESQPDFLKNAEYIYGKAPILLPIHTSRLQKSHGKLCVDQREWQPTNEPPFADGTNPSILLLDRIQKHQLYSRFKQLGATYIATVCVTNSQCSWNDTPDEKTNYGISERSEPLTLRTILLLLDADFRTIRETTIYLERNAPWGKRNPMVKNADGTFQKEPRAFDDARLFLNGNDQVWISFREGKGFGFDRQVIMEVKMDFVDDDKWTATVFASETSSFCCGRNMALMQSKTGMLQSLTWVDPVTVVDVYHKDQSSRQLLQDVIQPRLKEVGRESHFHGTNAFMVPFGNNELLGIGHFHRPPGRDKNDYARFGHHYTHAFFTIPTEPPYYLKRLSAEFVLPSKSTAFPTDADSIQFASGLEVDGHNVILAYGINDCEGAAVMVDWSVVNGLLQNVPEGMEVIDLMSKLI